MHDEATLWVFCGYSEKSGRIDWTSMCYSRREGKEPAERRGVIDAIDELRRAGMLDACGSDFYKLTERGKGQSLSPE